jgi:hypothetical protein
MLRQGSRSPTRPASRNGRFAEPGRLRHLEAPDLERGRREESDVERRHGRRQAEGRADLARDDAARPFGARGEPGHGESRHRDERDDGRHEGVASLQGHSGDPRATTGF